MLQTSLSLSSTGNGLTHDVIGANDSEEEVIEQHLASEYMNEKMLLYAQRS